MKPGHGILRGCVRTFPWTCVLRPCCSKPAWRALSWKCARPPTPYASCAGAESWDMKPLAPSPLEGREGAAIESGGRWRVRLVRGEGRGVSN